MREAAPAAKPSGVLRPWQRRLYRLLLIPLGLIAANSIYLFAFTRDTAFFYAMLLLHLTPGIAIAIPFFVFAVTHARRMIRMWNKRAKYAGLSIFTLATLCVGTGVFMTFRGATLNNRAVWLAHVASVPLALVAFILHRRAAVHKLQFRRLFAWGGAVAVFLAAMAYLAHLEKPPRRIVNRNGDTVFFPSSSETFDQGLLDAKKLAANEYCQSCHPDSFHQWERSAHRFSSFNNPFYRKSVELMADRGGARAREGCPRLPRPGRALHRPDGRRDPGEVLVRLLGGPTGLDLHVLPLDHGGQGRPGKRVVRHRRVQTVSIRVLQERDTPGREPSPDPNGAVASPQDLLEAGPSDPGVLLLLPQGGSHSPAELLPLDARAEPLRHLVRLGRFRTGGALLLRSAADEGLPGLPSAPVPLRRVRKQEGPAPRSPVPRGEHSPAVHPGRQGHGKAHPRVPREQGPDRGSVRDPPRRGAARSRSGPRFRAAGGNGRSRSGRAHARDGEPLHERHRGLERDVGVARGILGSRLALLSQRCSRRGGTPRPGGGHALPDRHRSRRRPHGPAAAAGQPPPPLQQRDRPGRRARRALPAPRAAGRQGLRGSDRRGALPKVLSGLHDVLARRGVSLSPRDDARARYLPAYRRAAGRPALGRERPFPRQPRQALGKLGRIWDRAFA